MIAVEKTPSCRGVQYIIDKSNKKLSKQDGDISALFLLGFVCQWGKEVRSPNSCLGVGYIGDQSATVYDAYSEALHLSQVLGGALVFGIQRQKLQQVEAMIECWEAFIRTYHYGHFIQYFYRDGADVVEKALHLSHCSDQITLVGINPSKLIKHPHVHYYRSWGDINPQSRELCVVPLAISPNSLTIWNKGLMDPVFTSAIQTAYNCTLSQTVATLGSTVIINVKSEEWPEARIEHFSQIILCYLRVCEYSNLLAKTILKITAEDKDCSLAKVYKNLPLGWYIRLGFAELWALQGTSSALLVVTAQSKRWKYLRLGAIAITSTMMVCCVFDGLYNVHCLFYYPKPGTLVQWALITYDVTTLARAAAISMVKPLRTLMQCSLQKHASTTVQCLHRRFVKVSNTFRKEYQRSLTEIYLLTSFIIAISGWWQLAVTFNNDYLDIPSAMSVDTISGCVKLILHVVLILQFVRVLWN